MFKMRSLFKDFFLFPFWIFYYYLYCNYLRYGRSREYANSYAPMVTASLFLLGPAIWFIKPINVISDFIAEKNGLMNAGVGKASFLVFSFLAYMFLCSYLRRKHNKIMNYLESLCQPGVGHIFVVTFLYFFPFYLTLATINNYFFLSTLFILVYQIAFYLFYFSRRKTEALEALLKCARDPGDQGSG